MTAGTTDRPLIRVVIIDDTPDFRLLLGVALESFENFVVVAEASDGAEGLAVTRETQPDVVLIDLAMPSMDGLEATSLIRQASPDSRVVVLSGFEEARMGGAARAAGASGYLQKGASPDQIVATINEVLGVRALPPRRPAVVVPPTTSEASELVRLQTALTTAAHELRSPATILVGLAQILASRRRMIDEDAVDRILDAILRQTRLLDRVTADLLTSSQTDRTVLEVHPASMLLAPSIAAAAVAVADKSDLRISCPPELSVLADRERVEQMLANLISNALKYGEAPIDVTADYRGAHAEVQVSDRGVGVPETFRGQLFGQYARADGLQASGTGIGLYVVRSLAEAQGGAAWYAPRPGGGSTFGFALPRDDDRNDDAAS